MPRASAPAATGWRESIIQVARLSKRLMWREERHALAAVHTPYVCSASDTRPEATHLA